MATLELLNGTRYVVKKTAYEIAQELNDSTDWILLPIMVDNLSHKGLDTEVFIMKNAIACWF